MQRFSNIPWRCARGGPRRLAATLVLVAAASPLRAAPIPLAQGVAQTLPYSCGAAALATVLGLHGLTTDERQLADEMMAAAEPDQRAIRQREGFSLWDLYQAANRRGLFPQGYLLSRRSLERIQPPAIVRLALADASHYAVWLGSEPQAVHLFDPSRGRLTTSWPTFLEEWSGHVLVVAAGPREVSDQPRQQIDADRLAHTHGRGSDGVQGSHSLAAHQATLQSAAAQPLSVIVQRMADLRARIATGRQKALRHDPALRRDVERVDALLATILRRSGFDRSDQLAAMQRSWRLASRLAEGGQAEDPRAQAAMQRFGALARELVEREEDAHRHPHLARTRNELDNRWTRRALALDPSLATAVAELAALEQQLAALTVGLTVASLDPGGGAAALATLLATWGEERSEGELLRAMTSDEVAPQTGRASSFADLARAARGFGHQAIGIRSTTAELEHLVPVIVTVAPGGESHFAVVRALTANSVDLADPVRGNRHCSLTEFLNEWTGHALVVRPGKPRSATEENP